MNLKVKRALTCATGLAAALSAVGAISLPSEARPGADDGQSARLAQILREDPTASLDSSGRLFYTEPLPTGAHAAARSGAMTPAAAPQFPLDQTFELHSNPGSQRTIFLDFDGGNVSGSAWNQEGLPNGSHPAWDPSGNGASFNNSEKTLVQEVWQWVAEDYAPFDVDVTTEDPGEAGIVRSGGGDQVYGSWALITPDDDAVADVCGECVGVAYLNVFDEVGGDSQPVWVFPQFYDEAKGIAETVSHEVGHNLNLEHDGNGQTDYAPGHDPWAPIMGNSDYEPISQWSKGDYAGANNHEDDFAVITNAGLSLRSDDAGNSIGAAAGPPAGTAYITTRTDKDFYNLGECSGNVEIAAGVASDGANLDIELRLYDADGNQVAIANPVSAKVSAFVATGMSATLEKSVTAGSYVVSVDGVGRGNWTNGYDDYASVGAYTLEVSGCDSDPTDPDPDPDPVVPGTPTITSVSGGPRGGKVTASVGWDAPEDDGGASITGYEIKATRWSRGFAVYSGWVTGIGADESFVKINVRKKGSWSFRVLAINDVGSGALSVASRRVQAR